MNASTLIQTINREIVEQQPLLEALREALSNCDPHLQIAVPASALPNIPEPPTAAAVPAWPFTPSAAPYRAV